MNLNLKSTIIALVFLFYNFELVFCQRLEFNDFNRLVLIELPEGTKILYSYDKLGNRTGQTIVPDGCAKIVTNLENDGVGSLRACVDCATELDTIQIAAVLQNTTFELESPVVVIDKELFIQVPTSYNITFTNKDPSNTEVLLNIQDNLWMEGLTIIGKTAESMIFRVDPGGSLNLKQVDMERVEVRH